MFIAMINDNEFLRQVQLNYGSVKTDVITVV